MGKIISTLNFIRHNSSKLGKDLIFLLFAVIVVWSMPRTMMFKYDFKRNLPWEHPTLYAPFDFAVQKDNKTLKRERDSVLKTVKPIFLLNNEVTKDGREALIAELKDSFEDDNLDFSYAKQALVLYDEIERRGILAYDPILENMSFEVEILLLRNRVGTNTNLNAIMSLNQAADTIAAWTKNIDDPVISSLFTRLIINSLRQNVNYSSSLTQQTREQSLAQISETFGMVSKNDVIISEGEIVGDDKFAVLNSLQTEYDAYVSDSLFSKNYLLFGHFLSVVLVSISLLIYLRRLRPDYFEDTKSLFLILLLMLIGILPFCITIRMGYSHLIPILPIVVVPMLLVNFTDTRMAIFVNVMVLILVSLIVPNSFRFFFVNIFVTMVPVFLLGKYRSRSVYMLTSCCVFLAYVLLYLVTILIYDGGFNALSWQMIGYYAVNALLSLMALLMSYVIERVFGYVSDITLLELSNTNTPLLRRLSSEAPGTFQHSMQVADICEELIRSVGGNPLLGRTGALYHDVGKLSDPRYFVENQYGGKNLHEDLTNTESAAIIIRHVINGVELCHKYRIPEEIIDFVRSHHGTRLTNYFYKNELEINPDVDESLFRYHGPKPFSKETAILMMADSVEAASRSLKDFSEEKIENLVNTIIDDQVKNKQFDNTDITYRDIAIVKMTLKKKLMNINHVRIQYPE